MKITVQVEGKDCVIIADQNWTVAFLLLCVIGKMNMISSEVFNKYEVTRNGQCLQRHMKLKDAMITDKDVVALTPKQIGVVPA